MSEPQYDSLQLVGLHEPDFSVETDESGHKFKVPLPGMYRFGVKIGDKFVEIATVKAGNIIDAIEKQKGEPSTTTAVQPGSSSEDVSALATRVAALEAQAKPETGPQSDQVQQSPSESASQSQ